MPESENDECVLKEKKGTLNETGVNLIVLKKSVRNQKRLYFMIFQFCILKYSRIQ